MKPYFSADNFTLYQGDCVKVLPSIHDIDMVFADPPYFLSNGGLSIQSGKIVSVDKGAWDKLNGQSLYDFNYRWLSAVRGSLKPNGTVWISGTMHNIFSVYQVLTDLGFKILNTITWKKLNPPPCFSCRFFTSSTEIIIWARKEEKTAHVFNYDLMKAINGGKQMKDVWELPAIAKWEKTFGKHPTQKPLSVVARTILASTHKDAMILDPFAGASTTGIAAYLFDRRYIGIDIEKEFLEISKARYEEATSNKMKMAKKIYGIDYSVVSTYDSQLDGGHPYK